MATTGWCVRCKSKQEMENEVEGTTTRGVKMVRGVCKICKTKMCKMGGKT